MIRPRAVVIRWCPSCVLNRNTLGLRSTAIACALQQLSKTDLESKVLRSHQASKPTCLGLGSHLSNFRFERQIRRRLLEMPPKQSADPLRDNSIRGLEV